MGMFNFFKKSKPPAPKKAPPPKGKAYRGMGGAAEAGAERWAELTEEETREFMEEGLLIYLQSTNVEYIQYLNRVQKLRVKFHEGRGPKTGPNGSGEKVLYHDVPPDMMDDLLRAPSKGAFVFYNLSSVGWAFSYE